jgi:hypothetical protein
MEHDKFTLNTMEIAELGSFISEKLRKNNVQDKAKLIIYVSKEHLRKIDEDLYYRNENRDKNDKLEYSEEELMVNFDNVLICVRAK